MLSKNDESLKKTIDQLKERQKDIISETVKSVSDKYDAVLKEKETNYNKNLQHKEKAIALLKASNDKLRKSSTTLINENKNVKDELLKRNKENENLRSELLTVRSGRFRTNPSARTDTSSDRKSDNQQTSTSSKIFSGFTGFTFGGQSTAGGQPPGDNEQPYCEICHKHGHIRENCPHKEMIAFQEEMRKQFNAHKKETQEALQKQGDVLVELKTQQSSTDAKLDQQGSNIAQILALLSKPKESSRSQSATAVVQTIPEPDVDHKSEQIAHQSSSQQNQRYTYHTPSQTPVRNRIQTVSSPPKRPSFYNNNNNNSKDEMDDKDSEPDGNNDNLPNYQTVPEPTVLNFKQGCQPLNQNVNTQRNDNQQNVQNLPNMQFGRNVQPQ